jgi:hypothetical protein
MQFILKGGNAMKCIACGREMIAKGDHLECSNILCDYEEEVDARAMLLKEQLILHSIFFEPSYKFSFVED